MTPKNRQTGPYGGNKATAPSHTHARYARRVNTDYPATLYPLKRMKRTIPTPILAAFCCLLWASAFAFIKIGIPYSQPIQFAGQRFLLAGLMVAAWVAISHPKAHRVLTFTLKNHWPFLIRLALLQVTIKYALFYLGIDRVPAAIAAILTGIGPLSAILVTRILPPHEPITKRKTLALLFGTAGVVVLTLGRQSMGVIPAGALAGILLLIGNTIVSAIGDWAIAHRATGVPPIVVSATTLSIGGAILLLIGWLTEGFIPPSSQPEYWLSLLALCAISAAAISIWFSLLRRQVIRVGTLNLWKFLIPPFGALIAWIILPDEKPTLIAISGMALIGTALTILATRKRTQNTPQKA